MTSLLDIVREYFDEMDWPITLAEGALPSKDEKGILTKFHGENGELECYGIVDEAQERFVFYSECPVPAPENKLAAVAEFITRANHELVMGNFEFDYSDGEILFKTSIDVEGAELSVPLVKHVVLSNVLTLDKYLPGIMKVINTDSTPTDVLADIEG